MFQELPTFPKEYLTAQERMRMADPRKFLQCYFHAYKPGEDCAGNSNKKKSSSDGKDVKPAKRQRVETSKSAEPEDDESDHQEVPQA